METEASWTGNYDASGKCQ